MWINSMFGIAFAVVIVLIYELWQSWIVNEQLIREIQRVEAIARGLGERVDEAERVISSMEHYPQPVDTSYLNQQ